MPLAARVRRPHGRARPRVDHRAMSSGRVSQPRDGDLAQLAAIVTLAHETGMRQSEVLGQTWERVDFSRAVIRLEFTKSGRRREVPMRDVVHGRRDRHRRSASASSRGGRHERRRQRRRQRDRPELAPAALARAPRRPYRRGREKSSGCGNAGPWLDARFVVGSRRDVVPWGARDMPGGLAPGDTLSHALATRHSSLAKSSVRSASRLGSRRDCWCIRTAKSLSGFAITPPGPSSGNGIGF